MRDGVLMTAWVCAQQRAIIDTDPGTGDALAIFLALNSPELKVEAFTVVPGNVVSEQGLENARKLVSVAGRCDVPVAAGATQPLMQKTYTATRTVGILDSTIVIEYDSCSSSGGGALQKADPTKARPNTA